ncbi:hypothetical protein [Synechococcus sp. MU1655]|uniref:hypothetical protein n=1 Tax=Synechococcus sp. MU1655 TaxID=2508355 RepID=UPI002026344A|nr:hypothetical protein [Synechococcus sp. MU1655]
MADSSSSSRDCSPSKASALPAALLIAPSAAQAFSWACQISSSVRNDGFNINQLQALSQEAAQDLPWTSKTLKYFLRFLSGFLHFVRQPRSYLPQSISAIAQTKCKICIQCSAWVTQIIEGQRQNISGEVLINTPQHWSR